METLRERRIRLSDGAETTLQQWGERGPLLLGLHGVASSRRGWMRIGEYLAGSYRVAAYDQRGHGDTSVAQPMTRARILDDLRDVVASLGEPLHALMGHSWGGAVVVAAGRELDAVERVVAIDPMLRLGPGIWSANVVREYRTLLGVPFDEREAAVRASYAKFPPVELDAKVHASRRLELATLERLGADSGIEAGEWDLRRTAYDYPKPLLLALPDPTRSVVPPEERDELRAHGGPHLRIEVFAGAGHSLQREAFDRFMPVLEAFLQG